MKNDSRQILADRLGALLAGMPGSRLVKAKAIGVSDGALGRILYVKDSNPGLDALDVIAGHFKIPTWQLLTGVAPASQPERFDDATMAQAIELLHLMSDLRPEDKRLRRITWPMILVAARNITKGSQREAVAGILKDMEGIESVEHG